MHASSGLSSAQVAAVAAVAGILLLLAIPASRRWLVNLWMQVGGWVDARVLAKHHPELIVVAVAGRLSGITLRATALFAKWLRARRAWFSWLGAAYNRALTAWEDAQRTLLEEEANVAGGADVQGDLPPFMPLGRVTYYTLQGVLGCGEGVLTYFAFQLWHLSPAWLVVVVLFSALVGACIGHLTGQAIYRRRVVHAVAIGLIGLAYCVLLGSMRFAWLSAHPESGGASPVNAVGAFGWPIVCLALGAVVGSQLRYLTPLEQARSAVAYAEQRCDALGRRGVAAVKALRDRMNAHASHKTASIDAYRRGFSIGWRSEPITLPASPIVLPDRELEALWPPERPSSTPSPAVGVRPTAELAVVGAAGRG